MAQTTIIRPAIARMLAALEARRFFKLIGGGSLTEAARIEQAVRAYAQSGADCVDVAPDLDVIQAVERALDGLAQPPAVMISLPLDPDPHFRKIELDEPACIRCSACIPVCPTGAITLPELLEISQSLCYGCGRCLPTCPTDALSLLPFQVEAQIAPVLAHPLVEAVEIHSHYVDPYMLEAFLIRWGPLLRDKLLSLCFRPGEIPDEQLLAFVVMARRWSPLPVMLQIDGAPMSGNDAPEASLPALQAASRVAALFETRHEPLPPLTVSGGINRHTADRLSDPAYERIAGVGMGTVARAAVWNLDPEAAMKAAGSMMACFKSVK